ncbi:DUF4383 domain-containing protein [Mycobacterium bohemicum]|nr:DUF4383 domain-containing protein [Mycobacterium bohemicum]
MLLAQGVLVCALGIGGLIADMLHPHAGPTGAKFLGLASTWPHNTMLVAFGVVAIVAVGRRRAAVVVTASSAVAYTILLFVTSVATARSRPTPFGFHAADIVLHGVLAVANFALLMWLIPDELGDEVWAPRRPEERSQDQPPPAASEAVEAPAPGSPAPRNGVAGHGDALDPQRGQQRLAQCARRARRRKGTGGAHDRLVDRAQIARHVAGHGHDRRLRGPHAAGRCESRRARSLGPPAARGGPAGRLAEIDGDDHRTHPSPAPGAMSTAGRPLSA